MSGSVARAGAVMASGTFVSRVLGFVRAGLVVALLGAAAENLAGNAFALANGLPGTIYLLVAGGALNAVLVPQITRADAMGEEGRAIVDRLITFTLAGLLVLTVALTLAAGPVLDVYASGAWPDGQRDLAVAFAVWSLPQVLFYGTYALFGQLLNARGSFGPYTWAPVANNVVVILGLAAALAVVGPLTDRPPSDFGPALIAVIAGTATLGVAIQAFVLVGPLRAAGFRWRPRWRWRGTGLRGAAVAAGWTFASLLCTQAAFVVLSRTTTAAGAAAVDQGVGASSAGNAAWTNAFLLFMLPHSLIAVSLVTARFTGLSRSATAGDEAALRRDTLITARTLVVGLSFAAAGLTVLAHPIAVLLFGGGPERGAAIAGVVAGLALGLPAFSTAYLLQRLFYARDDARVPFIVQAVTSAVWVVAMVVIARTVTAGWVVPAVAAAMSASQVLGCALLLGWAARTLPGFAGWTVVSVAGRAVAAAVVAGLAVAGVSAAVLRGIDDVGAVRGWVIPTVSGRGEAAVIVAVGVVVGVLAFATAAWALRLMSVRTVLDTIKRR